MKKLALYSVVASSALAAALVACSGDNGNNNSMDASSDQTSPPPPGTDSGSTAHDSGSPQADSGPMTTADSGKGPGDSGSTTGDGGVPPPPTLGTEIDRFGRPAVNTALNHVFDTDAGTKNAAKDTYNADKNPADWTTYVPEFKKNLAIYDGLDTVCGNQAAFGALGNPDYTTLATVLSGDAMWLNTATATCNQYLAVELDALGNTINDCGGRTLTENVVDVTYNAVAGTFALDAGPSDGPLTNGITAPQSPPSTTFPYLAAPYPLADAGAATDAGNGGADAGHADAGSDSGAGGDAGIRDAGGQ